MQIFIPLSYVHFLATTGLTAVQPVLHLHIIGAVHHFARFARWGR